MGLVVPESHLLMGRSANTDTGRTFHCFFYRSPNVLLAEGDAEAREEEDEEASAEEEMDEITGYHFVECTTLFVAYVYVNSGVLVLCVDILTL